ncbi:hypothetical protein [Lonsdalea quercina]|uniref:hypothetical protein n=1 Tax=Lonsdalea quercina TaxID=71657 RepID=UPI0039771F2C
MGKDKGFFLLNASGRSAGVYLSTLPSARPNDPRAGKGRFERLQQLTYPGFEHQFKACVNSQHHCGASYFTIEDQNATEVLSVMLFDDYTVTTGKSGYLNMGLTRSYPFA